METTGKIVGVNGNMITVAFDGAVAQNEVGFAQVRQEDGTEQRLMSEIVRIRGHMADMQVFEDTRDLQVDDTVTFTGHLLSAELAPDCSRRSTTACRTPCPGSLSNAAFSCSAAPNSRPSTARRNGSSRRSPNPVPA